MANVGVVVWCRSGTTNGENVQQAWYDVFDVFMLEWRWNAWNDSFMDRCDNKTHMITDTADNYLY